MISCKADYIDKWIYKVMERTTTAITATITSTTTTTATRFIHAIAKECIYSFMAMWNIWICVYMCILSLPVISNIKISQKVDNMQCESLYFYIIFFSLFELYVSYTLYKFI